MVNFLTVATTGYLAQALVCFESLKRQSEAGRFFIFIPDITEKQLPRLQADFEKAGFGWVQLFACEQMAVFSEAYAKALTYFNSFEISTLSKITFSRFLMELVPDKEAQFVFLDSDLYFTAALDESLLSNGAAIGLTPHTVHLEEREEEVYERFRLGWVNSGFFIFKNAPETVTILNWLEKNIARFGFNLPSHTMFVDQLAISALPVIFHRQVVMLTSEQLNVAYWNLEERRLSKANGQYLVNGLPMVFFHFSGFPKTDQPAGLSQHVTVAMTPVLQELVNEYHQQIKKNTQRVEPMLRGLPRQVINNRPISERVGLAFRDQPGLVKELKQYGRFFWLSVKIKLWKQFLLGYFHK